MPAATKPTTAKGDDLDNLFDFDTNIDAIFKEFEENADARAEQAAQSAKTVQSSNYKNATTARSGDLGIDEEIKVAKKRQPIPKLDEDRLLSQKGIPKLRKLRERMKFRGKGYEFKDVQRMLNIYQFWLDDLYPRAKFMDGAAMIEKVGHSKRMQVMRKEWINQSKINKPLDRAVEKASRHNKHERKEQHSSVPSRPKSSGREEPDHLPAPSARGSTQLARSNEESAPGLAEPTTGQKNSKEAQDSLFLTDDDEGASNGLLPPEDELDALLAEDEARATRIVGGKQRMDVPAAGEPAPKKAKVGPKEDEFADEMEALAEMDGSW